jgi:uncharacterized repeat protein (TIGR03803 family)
MAKARSSALTLVLTACLAALLFQGPLSAQTPTFTVLYSFTGNADGANPTTATMLRDAQGNLYGTTQFGADIDCNISLHPGCGTVFRLDTAGKLTALHTFGGGSLGLDSSGLVRDGNGNLYGTAGGGLGQGLVFEVASDGAYTELYNFMGGSDGDLPSGILDRTAGGTLYGTTILGGGSTDPMCPNGQGCGTVFELGSADEYKVLYSFRNNADGAEPNSVIRDSAGNLFGTTLHGGMGCVPVSGCGTIFKLDATGKKTILHKFTGGNDGSTPSGGLVLDSAGNLYGATSAGGDLKCPFEGGAGCGVVFKLNSKGVLQVLHAFHGGSDGNVPASVILDPAGNLYGTTESGPNTDDCGTVFKLDAQGNLTNLHNIAGGAEGCFPVGALVRDAAGNLYGATAFGGYLGNPSVCLNGCGTLFEIKP